MLWRSTKNRKDGTVADNSVSYQESAKKLGALFDLATKETRHIIKHENKQRNGKHLIGASEESTMFFDILTNNVVGEFGQEEIHGKFINQCRKNVKPFTNVSLNGGTDFDTVELGSKSSHRISNNKLKGENKKVNNHDKYFPNIPKSVSPIQADECSAVGLDCNPIILNKPNKDDPYKVQVMVNKMIIHSINKLDLLEKEILCYDVDNGSARIERVLVQNPSHNKAKRRIKDLLKECRGSLFLMIKALLENFSDVSTEDMIKFYNKIMYN